MTYAITLVKSTIGMRDITLDILSDLKAKQKRRKNKVTIEECYISFGWPDFVLILKGENVELLKDGIVKIRNEVIKLGGGDLETSTIICTTKRDLDEITKSQIIETKK